MRVQILEEATSDLADGYRFYESQAAGLGDYFLDSLWSDILSLHLYGNTYCQRQSHGSFGYFRSRALGRKTAPNPSARSFLCRDLAY